MRRIKTFFILVVILMSNQFSGTFAADTSGDLELFKYIQREPKTLVLFKGPIQNPAEREYKDYSPAVSFLKLDTFRTIPFLFPDIDILVNTKIERSLFVSYQYLPNFDGLQILDLDSKGLCKIETYLKENSDSVSYNGRNLFRFEVEGLDQCWDQQEKRVSKEVYGMIDGQNRFLVGTSKPYLFATRNWQNWIPKIEKNSPLSVIDTNFFSEAKPQTIAAYRKFSETDSYPDQNICRQIQCLGFVRCGNLSESPYCISIVTRTNSQSGANLVSKLFGNEFSINRVTSRDPINYSLELSTADPVFFYNSFHLLLGYGYYY